MAPKPLQFPSRRWPFYLADALLVGLAAEAFLRLPDRADSWAVASLVVSFGVGAFLALLPHLAISWKLNPDLLPPRSTEEASVALAPSDQREMLADVALLTWRIKKRAERDPETHRMILRHADKVLATLAGSGVEIISYAGRKLDAGSNVQILDAVEGECNRVIEESDPQVQVQGRVLRRAMVTVGKGIAAKL